MGYKIEVTAEFGKSFNELSDAIKDFQKAVTDATYASMTSSFLGLLGIIWGPITEEDGVRSAVRHEIGRVVDVRIW